MSAVLRGRSFDCAAFAVRCPKAGSRVLEAEEAQVAAFLPTEARV